MSKHKPYEPGPAAGARVQKDGEEWTLVLVRELKHSPALVWQALTDPEQLSQWAPFDADRNLATVGPVSLATVAAPTPQVSASAVTRADVARLLEYTWGGHSLRWELEPVGRGTRLLLWHQIDRRFIAWGAAGWHVCFDVLQRQLDGDPLGRIVGADALKLAGWQRLSTEYAQQFGVENPGWQQGAQQH